MNPLTQPGRGPQGEPQKEFRLIKLWNPQEAKHVHQLQQKFTLTKGENTLEYYNGVAIFTDSEEHQEALKRTAEHYGIEIPTEEHNMFAENEALQTKAEKMGL